MAYTQLKSRHTKTARLEEISSGSSHYLLALPAGKANQYRLAQLDDYAQRARGDLPHNSPTRLSLMARTSSDSLPGTWGFGLWNDPFGLSLGFGGNSFRIPALPNAAWFFGASEENYLSFKEISRPPDEHRDQSERRGVQSQDELQTESIFDNLGTDERHTTTPGFAANGFIAQTFRSPRFDLRLIPAGLLLPFSRTRTRHLLGKVVAEEGVQLGSPTTRHRNQGPAPGLQSVDPTQWHRYRLDWGANLVSFAVDGELVLESPVSPRGPLGLVIWIDNQYAAFTPEGKIGFGVLENPEPAWLEVKEIEVT